MTDENVNQNENQDETPPQDPVAIILSGETKAAVEKAQNDGEIRRRVVESFAEEEINRRANLLTRALQARDAKYKEIQKLKPDNVFFNENGEQTSATWSKDALKKMQEAKKQLNKMDNAINKAVNNADYSGLQKFVQ